MATREECVTPSKCLTCRYCDTHRYAVPVCTHKGAQPPIACVLVFDRCDGKRWEQKS